MTYKDICAEIRALKLLLIARGGMPEQANLTTFRTEAMKEAAGIDRAEFEQRDLALLSAIATPEIAGRLWIAALMHHSDVCIEPHAHRLSWRKQDVFICLACRMLRDNYYEQFARKPATQEIDLRSGQKEATILPFVLRPKNEESKHA